MSWARRVGLAELVEFVEFVEGGALGYRTRRDVAIGVLGVVGDKRSPR